MEQAKSTFEWMSQLDYVDCNAALDRLQGNKQVYKKMLEAFSRNRIHDQMLEALRLGDMELVRASVHGIKGMAGNLSLPALYRQSSHVNSQLVNNLIDSHSLDVLTRIWQDTQGCVHVVLNQL